MKTTYVAFLRAINVGGRAVVKMADLKEAFVAAGCGDVQTYIQSGNVVFDLNPREAKAAFRRIHECVGNLLGAEPSIVFRTLVDLEKMIASQPFDKFEEAPDLKRYVALLSGKAGQQLRLPMIFPKEALEAVSMTETDVFIVSRPKSKGGMFGFPNGFVEEVLGISATTRNWNTIVRVVEFARRVKA